MKKISAIIPMYFEEKVAEECYNRMKEVFNNLSDKYEYEIIAINDGSKDETLNILERLASTDNNLKVISFSRNFGHQAAVTAGLKYAAGDCVFIIDADLQDPPEVLPDMLKYWEDGYDVILQKYKMIDFEYIKGRILWKPIM